MTRLTPERRREIAERVDQKEGAVGVLWNDIDALLEDHDVLLAENVALRKVAEVAIEALEFYADGETYLAIGFFPDPPCGEFMDDFSDVHDTEYCVMPDIDDVDMRPGKRARAALDALDGEKGG
jgi:hypothetical protein